MMGGMVAVAFLPEPAGRPLPGSGPVAATGQEASELASHGTFREDPG